MPDSNKIVKLEELAKIVSVFHDDGKTVAHCHGVFDLLHIGHIRHFEQAKKFADVLIVTITQDQYVNKGPHRPAFTEALRAESLASLGSIDYVAVNKWPTSVEAIDLLKPDFYVKGSDYKNAKDDVTGKIVDEENAVKRNGGKIVFTEDITYSSSSLINKFLPAYPQEITDYLTDLSERYTEEEILAYLENAAKLKVLVVGEAIIDEYQYCDAIGKSTKEPALVAQYLSKEKYAGGSLAVANHLAGFTDNVGLLTFLGREDTQEEFVVDNLAECIDHMFLYQEDAPTIMKSRFIEAYLLSKLFEVYFIGGSEISSTENQSLCKKLETILPEYDIVIAVDYGHGMMTDEAINVLCEKSKFLVVNTQTNAGNRGYNTIFKYPRADFVSIAEHELRLEFRDQKGSLTNMILELSEKNQCNSIIVTRGNKGNLCYNADEGFFEVPAFAQRVVDRIGAGDAVLSIASLCVAQKAHIELVGFIANVVGAEAVQIIGNKSSIEKASLMKHIISLLK